MIRKPRLADESAEAIILPQAFEKLKTALECPICRCIMRDPVYVKYCLHKYCSECLMRYYKESYASSLSYLTASHSVHPVERL